MVKTSRVVRDEIDNLLSYLIYSDLALYVNPVVMSGGRVSWGSFAAGARFLTGRDHTTLSQYQTWLADGAYSALLFDGSLLQLTFDFAGHQLVGHRLAWVPCPFAVDLDLLLVESPTEVMDLYADGSPHDVALKTIIRFDYDIARAAPDHPAAHLSINSTECRIACSAPLRLSHFVDFVFRNFYPDYWSVHPYLASLSRVGWGDRTVTEEEAARLHVAWTS
jgi:hypothetical protein